MSEINFEIILNAARQGDIQAENQLFELLHERIFNLVQRRIWSRYRPAEEIKMDAEDLTHEIYMTILSRYKTEDFEHGFLSWTFQIVRNKIGDYYRKMKLKYERQFGLDDVLLQRNCEMPFIEAASEQADCEDLIRRARAELSDADKAILAALLQGTIKEYIDGEKRNGVKINTIYIHIHRFRQRIMALLTNYGFENALQKSGKDEEIDTVCL
ncbi:MAG: RNA polymerase sigma factor [bacterium]